ncbi:CASP8 and FADD-like apoptosis regulator isoform X2 [Boleophthalmus pectinirostris]|uniref:CASP8 and FADD-like apoptosis regulator isoform X2 n=1 Tax=Boleophthalmus pectinirostris TaxID=150288 RepID=UPI0024316E18|nr:CASP8 and FADD-like apoptosis regulator isoform X2 [Boleophthalmus pectinirostris]
MSSPGPSLVLLCQLVEDLSESERRTLVFLCGSRESEHSPAHARGVLEGAVRSSERPGQVVKELLVQLRRLDLLRKLCHCGRDEVERQRGAHLLSAYRVLMVDLSQDLTTEDLNQLKFLLGGVLPRDRLDRAKCFLDVITELEKQDEVSSDRLDLIERCLRDVNRQDLAKRVRCLTNRVPEQTQVQRSCRPFSSPRPVQALNCHQQNTRPALFLHNSPGRSRQPTQRETSCSNHLEHYRLDTNNRGVCVIIDCVGQDGELLEQTFQNLHFSVVLHRWLSVGDCQSTLRSLQQSPLLRSASAFVCCVISRGTQFHLLATDARSAGLHLDSLRRMFTPENCPGLAGKPKLFFIQTYSVSPYEPAAGYSEDLETDGFPGQSLVPTDADVFWSHCWTSETQLQSAGHHSQYLRALMGALQAGRARSHLVDLHLRVNADVCDHNQRNPSEQYHLDLRHTLRKNLYLH